jgi:hypothetical protein
MKKLVLLIVIHLIPLVICAETEYKISSNRSFEVIQKPENSDDYRNILKQAGNKLGNRSFYFAGSWVNGPRLRNLSVKEITKPLEVVLREDLKQAVDIYDFLLFLDDIIVAYNQGAIFNSPYITSSRARNAGIIIHTDDVFKNKPRVYGKAKDELFINKPKEQANLLPANNGDILGPRWTTRFRNPDTEEDRLNALKQSSPDKTFAFRLQHLTEQFRAQGAVVNITSTVRSRKRGYLMWGSFILGRCNTKNEVLYTVKKLERLNSSQKLDIQINWNHPDGWEATIRAARDMAESYDVVYATERGAFYSNHYEGTAVDIVIRGLPSTVTLKSIEGKVMTFDLSSPKETRDVSLTPKLIKWIENNYGLKKLKTDYPHWDDV